MSTAYFDESLQKAHINRAMLAAGESCPPTMWCPVCSQRTQQAPPTVSVRALIFALGRFGIVPLAEIESLEKRWAKAESKTALIRWKTRSERNHGFQPRGAGHVFRQHMHILAWWQQLWSQEGCRKS